MKSYKLSAEARLDYFEAFSFIAAHTPGVALQWERRMLKAFDHLAEWPDTGRIRPEYAPPSLRFWVEGDYLVIYDPATDPVEIVGVLHGARNVAELIGTRLLEHTEETPADAD